jgi:voltage-gated potassium channel
MTARFYSRTLNTTPTTPKENLHLFLSVLLSHFVLCTFIGLVVLDVLRPFGQSDREFDQLLTLSNILRVCLINGTIVALLVGLLHQWRMRRRRKHPHDSDLPPITPAYQKMAMLIAFICGALDIIFFITHAGILALTVITAAVVFVHIRRFLHQVVPLLHPERLPTWEDVGQLVHVYLTMIAAFTLITVSLVVIQLYVPNEQPAFRCGYNDQGQAINAFSKEHSSESLVDAFYFTVVVMTTLGFGDVVPETETARLFVSLMCLTSYIMFALMIGVITRGIVFSRQRPHAGRGP